jgi:hypothetical protein
MSSPSNTNTDVKQKEEEKVNTIAPPTSSTSSNTTQKRRRSSFKSPLLVHPKKPSSSSTPTDNKSGDLDALRARANSITSSISDDEFNRLDELIEKWTNAAHQSALDLFSAWNKEDKSMQMMLDSLGIDPRILRWDSDNEEFIIEK